MVSITGGGEVERHQEATVTWEFDAASDGSEDVLWVGRVTIRPRVAEVTFIDGAFAYVVIHGRVVRPSLPESRTITLFPADEIPPWARELIGASQALI